MGKFAKKFSIMMVVAGMTASALAGCSSKEAPATETTETTGTTDSGKKEESTSKYNTLIAGTMQFNGLFSPFYATTAYDANIAEIATAQLITNDDNAAPVPNLATFEIEEIKDDSGKTVNTKYTFKLKDGVTFSDGTAVTADDVIFTYKVLADPTYDGKSTFFTTPIVGINEYRYDDVNYMAAIAKLKEEAEKVSDEEVTQFIVDSCKGATASNGEEAIIDYLGGTVAGIEGLEGEKKAEVLDKAYTDFEIANAFDSYKSGAVAAKFKTLESEYIKANLAGGTDVTEIEGVKRIDDQTIEVLIEGVDPKAIWSLGDFVAPKHYYGVGKDGKEFTKGDTSMVKEKNDAPLGAGPYIFEKFENNVVSFKANETYHLGAPEIPTIKFQVTSSANKLDGVKMGEIDIADPTASPDMLKDVESANMHYELVDNLGYGYIGVNAERVSDINVRKGLMHLMNRKPAIDTYYGELATVIERPMSRVSWAYPQDAEEYYGFDPAKALEYFTAAGYTQVDKGGKMSLEKEGKQLKIEVGIPGDGIMDHPSAPIITQMKTEFEKIGGILEINDCDGTVFFDRLDAKDWDMWVAAWGATVDPDMYQVYYSDGPSNHYRIKDDRLDEVIVEAKSTNDIEVRKELYSEALDIIMEWAVEMPVYQRKNMFVINPEIVDITTLPSMSPFNISMVEPYFSSVQTLKLK